MPNEYKIHYLSNLKDLVSAFAEEGYSVNVRCVHKKFPQDERDIDYYGLTIEEANHESET